MSYVPRYYSNSPVEDDSPNYDVSLPYFIHEIETGCLSEERLARNSLQGTNISLQELPIDERMNQMFFRKVRGILNRITPQNFDKLSLQLSTLSIDSDLKLNGLVKLIMKKATTEEMYCPEYAGVCKLLGKFQVIHPYTKQSTSFMSILEKRIHAEFVHARRNEVKTDDSSDEEMFAQKRRALGLMRFIGEMYLQNIIACHAIMSYLRNLFEESTDTSIEYGSKILSSTGAYLQKDPAKVKSEELTHTWNKVWVIVHEIEKDHFKPNRIRFMMKNLIELKDNDWVPRKHFVIVPKTLEEIRQEFNSEEANENENKSEGEASASIEESVYSYLISDKEDSINAVQSWLKTNVGEKISDPHCVACVTKAVTRASICNGKLIRSKFESNLKLIKHLATGRTDLEITCLEALKNLLIVEMHGHEDVFPIVFQCLYDSCLVSTGSFFKWKDLRSGGAERIPTEAQGKGRAVVLLAQFYWDLSKEQQKDQF